MVKPDDAGPIRAMLEQRAIPLLGLGAHIGEDQRRAARLDFSGNLRDSARAEMTRPWVMTNVGRQQGVDHERLRLRGGHEHSTAADPEQRIARLIEIAQRRGQAPDAKPGRKTFEAREGELSLNAALAA